MTIVVLASLRKLVNLRGLEVRTTLQVESPNYETKHNYIAAKYKNKFNA
jgi:hypothetical protein